MTYTWTLNIDGSEPELDEVEDPDADRIDEDLAFERARERRIER
jgi:hypothetical protein